jgi:drug/metabolite transporter (DMT)-like permease
MFAAMSVIWGLPYLLIKVAVGGVPVPVLVLARVTVGAALLLPIALRGRQFAAIRRVWLWVALFAVVEIILPWFALSDAERGISSSLTGLLIASVPIIVAVLSLFLRGGDRLSPVRWTGLLIGLGGVAMLAGPNLVGSGASAGSTRSVAEVLFVAFCYATGPLIADQKLTGVPPVALTAACLALAAVVYAPLAAADWPSAVPSASVLLAIAGLAVVCTAGAFLIYFHLLAEAGPSRTSVITYINPAVAVSLGVAVLGEHVTPVMLAAFGTILAGSVLATRTARRPAEISEPAESAALAAAVVPAGSGGQAGAGSLRRAPEPEPLPAIATDSP